MRLFDEVPGWRYVVLAALALAPSFLVRWVDLEETDHDSEKRDRDSENRDDCVARPPVGIHVKYKPGRVQQMTEVGGKLPRRVFSRIHATTAAGEDPRDRWFIIDV